MMNKNSLKKSGTFVLKKSPSMELPTSPDSTTYVPRKFTSTKFPTSPSPIVREEINHFSHQQHPLVQLSLPDLFTCMGCKEYGAGTRFTCQQCDFQLHEFCALAPPALKDHPLHCQHQLVFCSKLVKGGILRSRCDICGKPSRGYTFQCSACSFQMHPCCAMLSAEMNLSAHPHTLKILPPSSDPGFACGECKRKRSGRVYRCPVCDYHLHAICAKDMVNGLHVNGIKGQEKPSMLGVAARLASQAFIEFIGGLIEGLGDGVGQVFIQSIAKGRCNSTTSRRRRTE